MLTPEQVCAYYSTLVAEQRLKVSLSPAAMMFHGRLCRCDVCLRCPVGRGLPGEESVHCRGRGGGVHSEDR